MNRIGAEEEPIVMAEKEAAASSGEGSENAQDQALRNRELIKRTKASLTARLFQQTQPLQITLVYQESSTTPKLGRKALKVVQEYERAVIFRLGRIKKGGAAGPGIFFVLPCMDNIVKVDLRTVTFDIPPQEILTKDSVTVAVDAVCYFRIYDPIKSVTAVANAYLSTQLLAQTTLRNMLGIRSLGEILSDREAIANELEHHLDKATDPWGIKVERVEIKDVRLPVQLQRAMAAEAEATREAKAKVIAAEGEQRASKALKEAADVISQSGTALQLRYLQTLNTIAAEKNSTIVFPIPIDMMAAYMNKK